MSVTLETRARIDAIKRYFAEAAELVRSDNSRTQTYIRNEIADRYVKAKKEITTLLEADNTAAAARQKELWAQTFGIVGVTGDRASNIVSSRDAADRAATLNDEHSALELLNRAERIGDEILARAVAERAYETGMQSVVNAFLEPRPKATDNVAELNHARFSDNIRANFEDAFANDLPKPPELAGLTDYDITRAATGQLADIPEPTHSFGHQTSGTAFGLPWGQQ